MKTNLIVLIVFTSLFAGIVFAQNINAYNSVSNERVINLNFNNIKGRFNTMFNECLGAGRANEGWRADWQKQLALVRKECGFKYIRMHGLLCNDMGVYKEGKKVNPSEIFTKELSMYENDVYLFALIKF